MDLAT